MALETLGGVLIEGPRGCGKTSTALQFAQSEIRLDLDANAQELAALAPHALLAQSPPLLIDEWQLAPNLWNVVRYEIDQRQAKGQFILTGSSAVMLDKTQHTGAGRIMKVRMRTLSSFETLHSDGAVSLKEVLNGQTVTARSAYKLNDIIEQLCRSGLPVLQGNPVENSQNAVISYLESMQQHDFAPLQSAASPKRVRNILRTLARNVGSEISTAKLADEIATQESAPLKAETLELYLDTLRALFIIEDVQPWAPHLRSSYVVRKAAKRYFADPAFAVASLGATAEKLLKDPNSLGFLFENLVIRDLQVYCDDLGAQLSHYRDSGGLEVDAIISGYDGKWVACEIKLNPSRADEAAKNLRKFRKQIDTEKSGAPEAMCIITTGEYSYVREDGIYVIAIGNLGP
jgi:predicted AAA+ superfamily ATPase